MSAPKVSPDATTDVRKALEVIGQALADVPATRIQAVADVFSSWAKERGAAVYLDVLPTLLTGLLAGKQHGNTARIYTFPTFPTSQG